VLERRHDVLAVTLAGHAGGPSLPADGNLDDALVDALERALDTAGFDIAHVAGNSADRLLPWPRTAARYRAQWLPHADWVELGGVGHCPQLDVPLEAAQLILGFTAD
jgi:hypothetical protein